MWLQYWSACITKAQEPNPLSSRDGRLLKPVPRQWKLTTPQLTKHLEQAVHEVHSMQAGLLCKAWGSAGQPDKATLALLRGLAYIEAGKFEQALRVGHDTARCMNCHSMAWLVLTCTCSLTRQPWH